MFKVIKMMHLNNLGKNGNVITLPPTSDAQPFESSLKFIYNSTPLVMNFHFDNEVCKTCSSVDSKK